MLGELPKPSLLAVSLAGVIGDGSPLTMSSRSPLTAMVSVVSSSSKESLLGAGVRLELDEIFLENDCSLPLEGVVE